MAGEVDEEDAVGAATEPAGPGWEGAAEGFGVVDRSIGREPF